MRSAGCIRSLAAFVLLFAVLGSAVAASSLREIDEAIGASDFKRALNLVESQIAFAPGDPSLLVRRARIHSYLGDFDTALVTLKQLRETYPLDVDYALLRAQVLARQGRDDEALADLREATTLAPDYEEVWQLRYTLISRQTGENAQLEREALIQQARLRFPQSAWWQTPATDPSVRWSILVGAGHEDLSNGYPSWNQQFIEVNREQESVGLYRMGVAVDKRFDSSDISVLLGAERRFATVWTAGLEISFADDPGFQPELSLAGHVGRSLKNDWLLDLRYRHRTYDSASVRFVTGQVEKYAGDFRFAYALGVSQLNGSSSGVNHRLTMNWYYSDQSSIGFTLNSGKETESVGPGQILETDVQGLAVSGRRHLTDRFSLQWWLGVHDQGDYYRRQYLGMAVSIRL